MQTDDRRTRILALVLITLIFVVFMAALVYWAVNVASPGIQSKVFVNVHERNPLVTDSTVKHVVGLGFGVKNFIKQEIINHLRV
jgi:hypothetical protein